MLIICSNSQAKGEDLGDFILPVVNGGTGTNNGSIDGTGDLKFNALATKILQLLIDGTAYLHISANGKIGLRTTTTNEDINLEGSVVINDNGADKDTRIEGDNDANLLFVDASTDSVGIGIATPTALGSGGSPRVIHIHQGSGSTPYGHISLSTNRTTVDAQAGQIAFGTTGCSSDEKRVANIRAMVDSISSSAPYGCLRFETSNGGTPITRMCINKLGRVGIGTRDMKSVLHVIGLAVYANNAAAVAAGLTAGAFYRTGGDPDTVCVVH